MQVVSETSGKWIQLATMFHLKYPKCRKFMNWDEIGSLCRSIGFPVDLVKSHMTDEIHPEEDGLSIQELNKMLDYNLLYPPLHHTYNMHTAIWNMTAIRKAANLLDHRVLTFQDVHNIRVAYQAYEAGDMKGMVLDQCVLLRTLKMCERVIAPMKLMNRVKHLKGCLEEKNRIQLSEFMDLVLWCGLYNRYTEGQLASVQGKENKLFRTLDKLDLHVHDVIDRVSQCATPHHTLIDFDKLLSHHDERLSKYLDDQYLEEEWNFGQQSCYKGNKKQLSEHSLKTDPSKDARKDKQASKNLKLEVGQSQQQVYRANAGYIRQRPLSALNLNMYRRKTEAAKKPEVTARTAYISIQKSLKSLKTRVADTSEVRKTCILKSPTDIKMQILPHVIGESDIEETEKKLRCLLFDVETLEGRCEISKQEEIDQYLPKYKVTNTTIEHGQYFQSESRKSSIKKRHNFKNYQRLAYPPPRPATAHSRICDARYRGWDETQRKECPRYILVSQAFENCPQGRLYQKLKRAASVEVRKVHSSNFLYRPMPGSRVKRRPKTAPVFLSRTSNHMEISHAFVPSITMDATCSNANSTEDKLQRSANSSVYIRGQSSEDVDNIPQCRKHDGNPKQSHQRTLNSDVSIDGENLKTDMHTKPEHRGNEIPLCCSRSAVAETETELDCRSEENRGKISLLGMLSESSLLRDDLIKINDILENLDNKDEDDSESHTMKHKENSGHYIVSMLLEREKVERQKKIKEIKTLQRIRNKHDGFSTELLRNAHILSSQKKTSCRHLKQHQTESSLLETIQYDGELEKTVANANDSAINCNVDDGQTNSHIQQVLIPDSSVDTCQINSSHSVFNHLHKNRYHRLLMRAEGDLSKTFIRLLKKSLTS